MFSVDWLSLKVSIEDIGMAPVVGVELIGVDASVRCLGLIDTGSDISVIDKTLLEKLGDLTHFSAASAGRHEANLYLIDVRITGDAEGEALTFENVPAIVQALPRPLFSIGRRGLLDRLRVELDFTRKRCIDNSLN